MNGLEEIDVRSLPSLPLSWRKAFPKTAAIYFVLSKDETLLYIGRSNDFNSRWKQHHKLKELEGLEDLTVAWLDAKGDSSMIAEMEYALIEKFKPPLNCCNTLTKVPRKKWAVQRKNVNLTEEDLADLERLCLTTRQTESGVMRDALRWYTKELIAGRIA